jgi:carboxyvinyl-carboxyphosphonate phosphorylmutase
VFDAISARLARDAGFEVGMFAGSVASATVRGAPDLAVITLSEFADQAGRITRGADLPLLVDADHGYGNALSVMRTVEELERAGVSALTIEDTVLPRRYGSSGREVISVAEFEGKLGAAVAARADPSLVVLGRTQVGEGDLAGLGERLAACVRAGVDGVFLIGARTPAELEAAAAAAGSLPLILNAVPAAINDQDLLHRCRVGVALQGHLPFQATVKLLDEVYRGLRAGSDLSDRAADAALLGRALRQPDYDRWTKDFLAG